MHETVGEREGTDPPDRWSVRARCSLASEMPLTGVQYREKFEEETHRIVYQCTRDEFVAAVIYHAPGGKISRFMDREYTVDRKNRFLMARMENVV